MWYTIQSPTAVIYAKPDAKSERIDEALHGMKVQPRGTKARDFLYVETEYRYTGWIQQDSITPTMPSHGQTAFVIAHTADVLAAPKVQAPLQIALPLGSQVHILDEGDEWTRIETADTRTGYIRTAFLASKGDASRAAIAQTAQRYLHVQYRWGGKSAWGIDCSGLCFMAYWLNGIAIFRDARIEPGFPIKEIAPSTVQEGDLLFFPGHVGMWLGDGLMIHASEKGNGVGIEWVSPEWEARMTAAGSAF
jgi:cell wall-associated NlpC family hydrolase